jgi:hypothetical protein
MPKELNYGEKWKMNRESRTALVIDKEADVVNAEARMLSAKLGYEVLRATSQAEALRLSKGRRFSFVVIGDIKENCLNLYKSIHASRKTIYTEKKNIFKDAKRNRYEAHMKTEDLENIAGVAI